eukprot:5112_1
MLSEACVLVTGAGKGIGRGICTAVHELGASVIAVSRTQADLDSLKKELSRCTTIQCDLGNRESLESMLSEIGECDYVAAAKAWIARGHRGAIVNVSSVASRIAFNDHTAYGTSKAALDQLTRQMARELGTHGIRCNAVNPTVVLTDMGRAAWSDPKVANPMKDRIPLGRFVEVDEVAKAVIYLLTAEMINGVLLPVDGGLSVS